MSVNCLSHWFPLIEKVGLPVPRTAVVRTDVELVRMLDGEKPEGLGDFLTEILNGAVEVGGTPFFLRTGYGSGKHAWTDTCYVRTLGDNALLSHVVALVEWSHSVDLFGLPTDVWAVREMIDTEPLFVAFNDMPITREFRVFVRDGLIEHVQPYWPEDAFENAMEGAWQGEWLQRLRDASRLKPHETNTLRTFARRACLAVGGGYWSVDMLQDRDCRWWITDMAEGEKSFLYEPTS